MSTSSRTSRATIAPPIHAARARALRFEAELMVVSLEDGRALMLPLAWYPRLVGATAAQRDNWQLVGRGAGIHSPDLDQRRRVRRVQRYPARCPLDLVVPLDLARQVDALDAALRAAGPDRPGRRVDLVPERLDVGELADVEGEEEVPGVRRR